MGLGRLGTRLGKRQRRFAGIALTHSVVPPARRARLQRHGDALRREPLRARSSTADRRSLAHAAPALSRRAYVLYRRRLAQSLQRRRQDVLSINAVMQRAPAQRACCLFPLAWPVATSRGAVERMRVGDDLSVVLVTVIS